MPIDVYESTRFETLFEQFHATISTPQSSPLAVERIVVPGRGWESWMNQQLAARFGCWAQFQFQPLGLWIGETLEQLLGSKLAPRREPDALTWDIAALLPGLCREAAFAPVRGYLATAGSADSRPLIDLARCIAGLFDRYLLYRPELITAWESGQPWAVPAIEIPAHAAWQQQLWLKIQERRGFRSVHAMVDDLRERLTDGRIESKRLGERVSVWLNAGIAPVHLVFLEAVGRHVDISVYVLSPAAEFWGDMRGRRNLLKQLRDEPMSLSEFCRVNHLEVMHPLLASLGDLSRQQQMLMVDCDSEPWRFHEFHEVGSDDEENEAGSLLEELQSDIRSAHEPTRRTLPSDNSVRIHSCHTALREVEVLHSQLRDALESDSTLTPEDIVVMCPDIETYAPLVRAVFGVTAPGRPGHIPFTLAGKSLRRTWPVPDAYFQLLDMLPGRFEASVVLDALNVEVIGSASGLRRDDVARLGDWISAAGVRWGLDAEHRESEELPPSPLHTFQHGLDRLLLGFAMPPGSESLVGDVLTLDRAEGLDAVLPGRLWAFLNRLRTWRERLSDPRPMAAWREPLATFARQLLDTTLDERGLEHLYASIDRLVQLATDSEFHQPLPLPVVARELSRQVDDLSGGAGVRIGGVTFCGLDDLRSLPYRVVGLLGMHDGAFPRSDRPLRFDLMTEALRPGDRTSRGEDRHLFLEAVLAARSRIIITFQGQNDRDQKQRPASVVVEELREAIERSHLAESGEAASELLVRHPLQPFSPTYFDEADSRLFAFDDAALAAARQLSELPSARPVFAVPLSHPSDPLEEIRTHDLKRLLDRPWTLYLERLGIFVDDVTDAIDDQDVLLLDALEEWVIGDRWLSARLSGQTSDRLSRWLLRTGQLPAGALGQRVLADLQREGDDVLQRAIEAGITTDRRSQPTRSEWQTTERRLHIDIEVDAVRIVGDVSDWSGQTIQRVAFSKITNKRIPTLWLDTLLATVGRKRKCSQPALLVGRRGEAGTQLAIEPPSAADARENLRELVELLRIARDAPLPLFGDSLAVVVGSLRRDRDALNDLGPLMRRARNAIVGYAGQPGAAHHPAVQAAFSGQDPFAMTCRNIPGLSHFGDTNLFTYLVTRIAPAIAQSVCDD